MNTTKHNPSPSPWLWRAGLNFSLRQPADDKFCLSAKALAQEGPHGVKVNLLPSSEKYTFHQR